MSIVTIIPLEQKIENELAKENVTEKVIAELGRLYGGLRLKSIDDKESYLELKAASKHIRSVEIAAEKICKFMREDAIKEQKLCIAKEKEILEKTGVYKNPIDSDIALFEAEVKRKEAEEKERKESIYINRQAQLTKVGAVYQDGSFVLQNVSYEANLIKEADEEMYNDVIFPKYNAIYQKIEAERIAAEKLKEEQEAEMKRKQEEFEQKQKAFEEQQAAFKKQQEEAERLANAEKLRLENEAKQKEAVEIQRRCNQLSAMGMTFSGQHNAFVYEDVNVDNNTEISLLNGEEWEALVIKIAPMIEQRKQEAEQKKLAEIEKQKEAAAELAAQKERERIAEEQRQSEIKRQQEEQRKAEELAQSDDKTKWASFIQQLNTIAHSEMKSPKYRKMQQIAKEKIEEILSL